MNEQKMAELMSDRYGLGADQLSHFLNDDEAKKIQTENLRRESDMDIAVLVVRTDDLIFRPLELTRKLCLCAGGTLVSEDEFEIMEEAAKEHGNSSTRSAAMALYGDPEYRYSRFSRDDFEFIDREINHDILKIFGFDFNRDIFERVDQQRNKEKVVEESGL